MPTSNLARATGGASYMRPNRPGLSLATVNRGLFAIVLALCASIAAACSSPPDGEFTTSSSGGPVPHEIVFSGIEESGDARFLWEFGDGATSAERSPTHVYQDAGQFNVRLTVSKGGTDVVSTQEIITEPGEAGWVTVEPASAVLESGDRVQFTASAFDALGNPIPDASFAWSADSSAGEVLEDGTFIAGPAVGNHASAVTVEYERIGVSASLTVPVEIEFGSLDSITVDPPSINLRAGGRVDLSALAFDRQGHVLPDAKVEWQAVRGSLDTVLAGGEFRAGSLPTQAEQILADVRVTVGSETLTHTVYGNITTGILDRLDVDVSPAQIAVDTEVTLAATGYDRFGNEVELDSLEWELVDESYGTLAEDGIFTPGGAAVRADGPVVRAIGTLERVRSMTEVELVILPGIAAQIVLSPLGDSIPVGASNPFAAFVTDEYGNILDDVPVQWTTSEGGTVNRDGIFTAGFETGEFTDAVTATVLAGAGGNLREITASADIKVRDRSSDLLAVEVSNGNDAGIILIDLINAAILSLSDELDADAGIELSPAWWPDGSRLAYSSNVTGTMQIYDIELETRKKRQLVDVEVGSAMPAISPDGSKIAFVVTEGDNWQMYVAELPEPDSEGNVVPVTLDDAVKISEDDEVQYLLPWWSPDGTQILYTISRSIRDVETRIVPSDGSSPSRRIGEVGFSGFGWSNDGEHALVVDNDNGGSQSLLVVGVESGEVAGLIPLPFQAFLAAWGPDNSEAAVIDRIAGALWLLDADGSSLRQALGSSFVPRRTAWRPVAIDAEAVLAAREAEQTG